MSVALATAKRGKVQLELQQKVDVFHQCNLLEIIGVSWKDHVLNSEVLERNGHSAKTAGYCRRKNADGRSY